MDEIELQRVRGYRYVLYARKSTTDEGSQFRSIDDQINECKEWAARYKLNIVKVIKEEQSAKISQPAGGKRQKFYDLIDGLAARKYDGIIAYHPDRLSRNTYDSGNLVDMLDRGLILDLKFPTTQFTNNASGKLMLNILFAMAKEYSEHLSESVQRGVDGNLSEGKSSGAHKWGYERATSGWYEPDDSFDLVQQGWLMRADGAKIEEIVRFWESRNLSYWTKASSRKKQASKEIRITKQIASKMFTDSFYYGLLRQSGTTRDLRGLEGLGYVFKPMVDEETWGRIQLLRNKAPVTHETKAEAAYSPLKGFIYCSICKNKDMTMRVSPSGRKGQKKLYIRCDNKSCPAYGKSIRMRVLLDDLLSKLGGLKFTERDYNKAKKYFADFGEAKRDQLLEDKLSLEGALKQAKKEFNDKSIGMLNLPKDTPQSAREAINRNIDALQQNIDNKKQQIVRISDKLENIGEFTLTSEEFLNIANMAADKIRAADPYELNAIVRIMLLNIEIGIEKAPSYYWKEPFSTLINQQLVNSGAP